MHDAPDGLDELRARVATAAGDAVDRDGPALARAAAERLTAVLDLIAEGRGTREAGSGLNPASTELLVAAALLTEAAANAIAQGLSVRELLAAMDLEALAARARDIDESASERAR